MTGVLFVQVKTLSSQVEQLRSANERNANLERELSECRERFERLQLIQNRILQHFTCPISHVSPQKKPSKNYTKCHKIHTSLFITFADRSSAILLLQ